MKEIKCPECGKTCLETDTYCRSCQHPLAPNSYEDTYLLEGIETDLWRKFIGNKAAHYINLFKKKEGKGLFLRLGIPCIQPTLWFFYRKMYVEGIISQLYIWAVVILWSFFVGLFSSVTQFLFTAISILPLYILLVLPGFFAPFLYKKHCLKHLKSPSIDFNRGGTSPATAFVIYIVLNIIGSFIISPLTELLIIRSA